MKRQQLVELEDYEWMPTNLRDGATDYLSFLQKIFRPYRNVPAFLNQILRETGGQRIIDFCSGGGGPYNEISPLLHTGEGGAVAIELSDRYPNLRVRNRLASPQISYRETGIDVLNPPKMKKALRTMFTSFHHFSPRDAEGILARAVEERASIAIFEVTERAPGSFLRIFAFLFLIFPLTPFIRPFRVSRILFTYFLPLIPLIVFWDGIVSCFRSYTEEELLQMGERVAPQYRWRVQRLPALLGTSVIAFSGTPRGD